MRAGCANAVVRALEKWTGETRVDVRQPEKHGSGPPVDMRLKLGTKEYAIEHTRIESFENQIGTVVIANRIIRHIRENIPDPFPSPAYCELQFPIDVSLPKGKARRRSGSEGSCRMDSRKRAYPARAELGPNPPGAQPSHGQRFGPGSPGRIRLRTRFVALADCAAHTTKTGTLSFRFIPPNDMEGPAYGQTAAGVLQEVSQASGVQDGRRPDRPGAGKQRHRSDELRIQEQPASFVAGRVHKCAGRIFLVETRADL